MLTDAEKKLVAANAYIPEHLVEYVTAVSGMEASLVEGYLCYHGKEHLNFIGYPLDQDFDLSRLEAALESALEKYRPRQAALIAPELPQIEEEAIIDRSSDEYLVLPVKEAKPRHKLRSLLRRASRELVVRQGSYGREHQALVREFLSLRSIDEERRYIFQRIPSYLAASRNALLLEARRQEDLAAFEVVDFSERYAFYMFNFLSREHYVPGASDLLFYEFLGLAREKGVKKINMGLRINEGVGRFKGKWGAKPFLKHEYCLFSQELVRLLRLSRSMGI
jgi:hypothetical protein